MIKGIELIGGRLAVNVLAADADNAARLVAEAGPMVLGGIITKGLTFEQAVAKVQGCHARGVPVSVGLGAGDPSVWRLAARVARETGAAHVNQVFPTACATVAMLEGSGTVVNALVAPSGTPGRVVISCGPLSAAAEPAVVSADTAAAMLAEAGIWSVKFFPVNGAWEEMGAMARAAARRGIPMFEPTGGLDASNVAHAARICLDAGCQVVVPHVYSTVVDKVTGQTMAPAVVDVVEKLRVLM
ncbi:MAG TPA: KDGP aldolase [Symbiobacteriaceae bacterium]|nr:KDGP aldolase [Symbiobacteriaceae bacterium]